MMQQLELEMGAWAQYSEKVLSAQTHSQVALAVRSDAKLNLMRHLAKDVSSATVPTNQLALPPDTDYSAEIPFLFQGLATLCQQATELAAEPQHCQSVYHFGPFRLDPQAGGLWREGEPVSLRPRSLALLIYLLRHAGRVISPDELMRIIWPGINVTLTVIRVCICEIRTALADPAVSPQYVETVNRRGYRFIQLPQLHQSQPTWNWLPKGEQLAISLRHLQEQMRGVIQQLDALKERH